MFELGWASLEKSLGQLTCAPGVTDSRLDKVECAGRDAYTFRLVHANLITDWTARALSATERYVNVR